jgi:D-xylose 1-dehydrogenase (NADP+, D-xylono-1,5-lactone-forming)
MPDRLRWGILGTGNIAQQFADGAKSARRGEIVAVGSRKQETAEDFAKRQAAGTAYGSYDALVTDPDVDAVYNSLPNHLHREWTIRALKAGKHVLCEKPFAMNVAESKEMFDAARSAKRVLVEAFMYRSHPLTHAVMDAVRAGEIGELQLIRTSFCYHMTRVENIRFDPTMGGGGLMDIGCYCINFSRLFAGEEPNALQAFAHIHERGVDDVVVAAMKFPGGVVASFTCGMSVHADNTAYLCGTDGYIEVPIPWKPPKEKASFTIAHSTPPKMDVAAGVAAKPARETRTVDAGAELYALEADDFAAVVLDGKPPAIPEQDTLGNMAVLDEMRRQLRR